VQHVDDGDDRGGVLPISGLQVVSQVCLQALAGQLKQQLGQLTPQWSGGEGGQVCTDAVGADTAEQEDCGEGVCTLGKLAR
jgi:hypothetical protein